MSGLRVEAVGKRYRGVAAVRSVDLDVPPGSRTAIVGPSGSGKTTLLRMIAGFEVPDEGRILLDGTVVADGARIVPPHRREIGFVPQDGALFPHLSIADNIGFGLPRGSAGREARIADLLGTVELDRSMLRRRPHELSGGQQQRVALARALARRPKLMLLDEPFSALDTGLRETLRVAVGSVLKAAGVTAILVTHDQAEALSFADQVAVLRDGRLVQAGTPEQLYRRPVDREAALFLGEALILPARREGGQVRCALGPIAIVGPGASPGPFDIMLRPEQISLAPLGSDTASRCIGTVVDTGFGGAVCTVAIRLAPQPDGRGPDGSPELLRLRVSSLDVPPRGSRVAVTVLGLAHAWPARTPGA